MVTIRPENKETESINIPSKSILKFDELAKISPKIGDEEKFTRRMKLCLGENTIFPRTFPGITDFPKAKSQGFAILGTETKDNLLSLPKEMYDGDQYKLYPELRKPVESIIYEYQRTRILYGLLPKRIEGRGWSREFRRKMYRLSNPPLSDYEQRIMEQDIKRNDILSRIEESKPIKGRKIA